MLGLWWLELLEMGKVRSVLAHYTFIIFYFFIILSFIVLIYFWAIKWIGADFQSLFCPGSDSSPRQCGSQGGDGGEVQKVF